MKLQETRLTHTDCCVRYYKLAVVVVAAATTELFFFPTVYN